MEEPFESLIILPEEAGERLDKVLKNRFATFSRTYFQFLIDEGAVLVNGEIVKKRTPLHKDDEIEVRFILTPEINLTPQNIPLDILFEDEHFLAVNKPCGMVVHPAPGHPQDTFVNALLFHCGQEAFLQKEATAQDIRPGIIHRLDRDTTGVLLAAKTPEAHRSASLLFSKREVKKTYFAFCVGNPGDRVIDAPIGRHPTQRKEMTVLTDKGKPAVTVCKTLGVFGNLAFVEVDLMTGRTHQIRVHLQHCGAPILGDPIYGSTSANKHWNFQTQLLHAGRLDFLHPITKEALSIQAPLPPTMECLLGNLSKLH